MKKSFILHMDSLAILNEMTKEQKGDLIDAIYKYHLGEELELDFAMKMAFAPFKNQFIRDKETYNNVVGRNRENGKMGGRPKKTQTNPNNPSGFLETQTTQSNPKNLDSDSKSDSVSESKKDSDSDITTPISNFETNIPDLKSVIAYFAQHEYTADAAKNFYEHYSNANPPWTDAGGKRINAWKQKAVKWFIPENKVKPDPKKINPYWYV